MCVVVVAIFCPGQGNVLDNAYKLLDDDIDKVVLHSPGMHPLHLKALQHRAFQARRFHCNQLVHCKHLYLLFWPVLAVGLWLCCLFRIKTEWNRVQKIGINDTVLNWEWINTQNIIYFKREAPTKNTHKSFFWVKILVGEKG